MDPLDEELAERGRLLIAAAVAETMAPLALRERIEADTRRAGKSGARPRSRGVMGWLLPAGGLVAAAAVVLALVLGGGAGAPSVLATAALATGGPVLPAPAEDTPTAPCSRPRWGACPSPTGATRSSGRPWARATTRSRTAAPARSSTTTPRARAPPTRSSAATRSTRPPVRASRHRNGTKLYITQDKGRRIVTWTRSGHTCVLSAPLAVPEQKLLQLASWKGKGNVPF